ncbi:MAG: hypothetical protein ACREMA_05800 [Longimicrobiales bacterium]
MRIFAIALLATASEGAAAAQNLATKSSNDGDPTNGGTRLLRNPSMSASSIAFEYGNDIWVAPRTGGDARRITSFQGQETDPHFSPDGRWLEFSAQYGGNFFCVRLRSAGVRAPASSSKATTE